MAISKVRGAATPFTPFPTNFNFELYLGLGHSLTLEVRVLSHQLMLMILVQYLNQLNYEATNVRGRSIVPITGTYNLQLTCSQCQWHPRSVGWGIKPVWRGHGFKPHGSPEFFSGFFSQLHKLHSTARIILHLISFKHFIQNHDLYHIHHSKSKMFKATCMLHISERIPQGLFLCPINLVLYSFSLASLCLLSL